VDREGGGKRIQFVQCGKSPRERALCVVNVADKKKKGEAKGGFPVTRD